MTKRKTPYADCVFFHNGFGVNGVKHGEIRKQRGLGDRHFLALAFSRHEKLVLLRHIE